MRATDARLLKVIATAGATYLGRFGSGIAVLITLPMARQALHPELFGVWMMLSALLSFMAFADLGVGNGVLNKTIEARATGDIRGLHRALASGYACTGAVGLVLLAGWLLWSRLSMEPTAIAGVISASHRADVLQALDAFALVLAVNIPASLIQRVQLGMQQGYWNGVAQFFSAILTLVAVPFVLGHGGSVAALVLATLGIQASVNIVNSLIWLSNNGMLARTGWATGLDTGTVAALLRTGSMFFLLQMSAAFAFQSDSIVITQTLGQHAYGDFAVVQRLFLFVSMILGAAMIGLWPAFGDAIASNNMAWAVKVLRRGMALAAVVAIVAVAALSFAIPWLMQHWLKAAFMPAWGLVAALAGWTVIDAVANVAAAFMNGANILRAQLVFAIGMASAAFAGKWLLTPMLGTTGAVLSTILAYCLVSVPGQIFIFKRVFKPKD